MELHVGMGRTQGALTVFPVWTEAAAHRGYSTDNSWLEVREVEGGPSVPTLAATNRGEAPLLMLEGQLLEGGWQTRTLVRSVLVPAHGHLDVEVACVEQGRWGGTAGHRSSGRRGSLQVRSALVRAQEHARQAEVWSRVASYDARYGSDETDALTGHLDRAEPDLRRLVRGFRPLPGQCGVVIGLGGQPAVVEVFDSPLTLRREFESIIRGAGLDALGLAPEPTPARRARRLVERAARQRPVAVADAGLGQTVRSEDHYAAISGLRWGPRTVHATITNVRHPLHAEVVA